LYPFSFWGLGCKVKGEDQKTLQTVHQTVQKDRRGRNRGEDKGRRILKEIEDERTSIDHALARYWGLHNLNGTVRFVEGDSTEEIPSDRDQQITTIEGE